MAEETVDLKRRFFDNLGELHRTQAVARGLNSKNHEIHGKARAIRDVLGLDTLLREPFYPNGESRYSSKEEFESTDLNEQERRQLLSSAFGLRQGLSLENTVKVLASYPEEVLTEKKGEDLVYSPYLTNVANSNEVIDNAGEHRSVVESYAQIASIRSLAEDFEKGKASEDSEKQLRALSAQGLARAQYDRTIEQKYSEELAQLSQQIALIGEGRDIKKEHVILGAMERERELIAEARKQYGKNYEGKVAEGVGKAITNLVQSGNSDKEQRAISILYRAKKGHGLGDQTIDEAFK